MGSITFLQYMIRERLSVPNQQVITFTASTKDEVIAKYLAYMKQHSTNHISNPSDFDNISDDGDGQFSLTIRI